ncbi:hypothetical protein L9F63_017350 [Diploptera punctata]|uniref:Farnesoic acid o-methyltransferase-like protein n=1 Tax=Diploptera punctata TaxID=6984 RepID=A0AAD7ZZ60_DIPPU|nr:hypothetical protein L9F63_017350 [Diploptera punctata]
MPSLITEVTWEKNSDGNIPMGALRCGRDKDGGYIYLGRAYHNGDLVPAKVVPNKHCAYVGWNGSEHVKLQYEVLCHGNVDWEKASNGSVPISAIKVGNTDTGECLYAGRVEYEGTLTPGKIQPSHGVCYVPYGGIEHSFKNYEVLVSK